MRLFILDGIRSVEDYCYIEGPTMGQIQLLEGEPVLPILEEQGSSMVSYIINEDRGSLEVGSFLPNKLCHLTMRTECAKTILNTGFKVEPYELVPAKVMNEKGRIHSKDIVILNPLIQFDCLDWSYSDLDDDDDGPNVQIFGKWALLMDKIPSRDLFRVTGLPGEYVFSEQLVQFIRENRFTCFSFEEVLIH